MCKIKTVFIFLCLFYISGCSLLEVKRQSIPTVNVINNQNIKLPFPSQIDLNVRATQILSAVYKGKRYTAQVQVEVNKNHIVLVALGAWGTELFSIKYNGYKI